MLLSNIPYLLLLIAGALALAAQPKAAASQPAEPDSNTP